MPLTEISRSIVEGGYVVALAAVCLIQYLFHAYRMYWSLKETQRVQDEMQGLEQELTQLHRDRAITRLENHILREFVAETDCERAIKLLMRRFVPNPQEGFAIYLPNRSVACLEQPSRGLTEASQRNLKLDEELLREVRAGRVVALDAAALLQSSLLNALSPADRKKVRQLYLLGVGLADDLIGTLVVTDLYPSGAPVQQQIELAERLMLSLASNVKHKESLELHQQQLRWTSDMLELRAIADRKYDGPLLMVEAFLAHLKDRLAVDRVALYLSRASATAPHTPQVATTLSLQTGLREQWQRLEEALSAEGQASAEVETFDHAALARFKIPSQVGSAALFPVRNGNRRVGVLCVTKQSRRAFANEHLELAEWAAGFLAERIFNALSQLAVEREARQDGLTGLANRRTFDQQIVRELQIAHSTSSECTLVLLDIDRFKSVNDTCGHLAGDQVLRSVAQTVQDCIMSMRSSDRALCARYGGEELAILLPNMSLNGAARIAEMIRAKVAETPVRYEKQTLRITLSAGIAAFPQHGEVADDLIAAADSALYHAKSNGRNRVSLPQSTVLI